MNYPPLYHGMVRVSISAGKCLILLQAFKLFDQLVDLLVGHAFPQGEDFLLGLRGDLLDGLVLEGLDVSDWNVEPLEFEPLGFKDCGVIDGETVKPIKDCCSAPSHGFDGFEVSDLGKTFNQGFGLLLGLAPTEALGDETTFHERLGVISHWLPPLFLCYQRF